MKNIKHLLDIVDGQRDNIALGLMSDPGLSKTSQINQWAEDHGRRVFEFITSQRMPSEISGMPMPVTDTKKMEIFDFDLLLGMKDGDVLFFDEFTNGNIMTLNACLTLIQDRRMLSGKKLPSIVVVAAGNPQGRCDLLPQTKQRFLWVDVKFDADCWKRYIKERWGMKADPYLVQEIEQQYRAGFKPNEYNYVTARTAENLLRIATSIQEDDPFWDTYRISNALKVSLYKTVKSVGRFDSTKTSCIGWCDWMLNCKQTPEAEALIKNLRSEIKAAADWKQLAEIIDNLDRKADPARGMFVDWLQSQPDDSVINPVGRKR